MTLSLYSHYMLFSSVCVGDLTCTVGPVLNKWSNLSCIVSSAVAVRSTHLAYTTPPTFVTASLTFPVKGLCVFSPVHLIVYVDTQVFVLLDNVHLSPPDADWFRVGRLFPEIHHQLLSLCDELSCR